jgi:hypothetical protein
LDSTTGNVVPGKLKLSADANNVAFTVSDVGVTQYG